VSQALEPEWSIVQESEWGEKALSVDCSAEAELCRRSGVSSFPAIRLHHRTGQQQRYRGERKARSILSFLDRTSRPALSYVTKKNATAFRDVDDVVFIGRFSPSSKHSIREIFATVARKYQDRFSFAVADMEQNEQQPATLECYNNPDVVHRSTAELFGPASIEAFVKLCSTSLIPKLTRQNELSFYEVGSSSTLPVGMQASDLFFITKPAHS
jgi:protein disulfide-isomerase A1